MGSNHTGAAYFRNARHPNSPDGEVVPWIPISGLAGSKRFCSDRRMLFDETPFGLTRHFNDRRHEDREMSKGYALFTLITLGSAIAFYNTNAILSLFCLMLSIGALYGAGKLG